MYIDKNIQILKIIKEDNEIIKEDNEMIMED